MKKWIILILVIFFNSLAFASYDEALVLYQKKKYKESLKMVAQELIIENDLKEDSPNYKLRFLAAHIHWKLGNSKSVVAHFRRCMDIKKETVDPYVDLAIYLTEVKRFGDAKSIAEKGLKIKKEAMLYWVLGRTRMNQGQYYQAVEYFEKANSLNPEIFISYLDLGIVLMKLKKYGEANTAFSAATLLNTRSAEAYGNLAMSFYKLSSERRSEKNEILKEARKNIEKAKELEPNNSKINKLYKIINSK